MKYILFLLLLTGCLEPPKKINGVIVVDDQVFRKICIQGHVYLSQQNAAIVVIKLDDDGKPIGCASE